MHLTTALPNNLALETLKCGERYVTRVRCTCGCNTSASALEHESEEAARREHEACVRYIFGNAPCIDLGHDGVPIRSVL